MGPGSAAHRFALRSIRGTQREKAGSNPGLFVESSFRGDAARRTRNLEIVARDSGFALTRAPE